MNRAVEELSLTGVRVFRMSRIYATAPLGPGRQAPYLNAVLLAQAHAAPAELLRAMKRLERQAGRTTGPHWGPRCLDIDVLDYGGRIVGWPPGPRVRGRLILPHPEMHRRAFVLVPLLEVAPHWRHPAFGVGGVALLAGLGRAETLGVRAALDFSASACDKNAT